MEEEIAEKMDKFVNGQIENHMGRFEEVAA